jgi:hypothetical protein
MPINPPLYQTGQVTPGHLAAWTTDGVLQDSPVAMDSDGNFTSLVKFLGGIWGPGLTIINLPTSSDGLPANTLWNNGGFLCIVS